MWRFTIIYSKPIFPVPVPFKFCLNKPLLYLVQILKRLMFAQRKSCFICAVTKFLFIHMNIFTFIFLESLKYKMVFTLHKGPIMLRKSRIVMLGWTLYLHILDVSVRRGLHLSWDPDSGIRYCWDTRKKIKLKKRMGTNHKRQLWVIRVIV